ncbi:MAG TPA: endonuclease/exonuclease/phosphatase family protein [Saprospiraceae bacterium]|nr:endonuclease/exonuclease/phosphatase family protein [Saprospiraceae bacterium]
MHFRYFLFLTLLLSQQTIFAQAAVDSDRIVKVLTFNILHGATTQGDFDLDAIAQVIIDAQPDLVALQEVDFQTNRAKKYDLVTELAWRTKLAPLFGRAMPYDGGEYGEGVLSRYSFLQTRNVALPHSPGKEPRAALEIQTILPSGDTIAFVGTHLDHTRDATDRIMQVEAINKVFVQNRFPTILAGDLNAVPDSRPIDILEEMWQGSYDKANPAPTYSSDQPTKKIDYIMYWPRDRWRVLETQVIADPIASDHCAYLVTLELLGG